MPDEDHTPLDITGDSTAHTPPMSQKQVAGQQKAQANRTRQGPQVTNPARQAPSPDGGAKPDAQPEDKPDQQPKPPADAQSQPEQGIGPAWRALSDGIGEISKDPAWMQHPLLRLFGDASAKGTDAYEQDLWGATQWWGHVALAFIDLGAMQQSASNIEHDNGWTGKIANALFQIHNDPIHEFAWNAMPTALSIAASWEPWIWGPELAAAGPSKVNQLPQALMGLLSQPGHDVEHPQLADAGWYERMGSYVLAAAMIAKGQGKNVGPLFKYTGRLKLLEPFAEHAGRIWGGPGGEKTPIHMQGGDTYDPTKDPVGHSYAHWYNENVEPIKPGESPIGKTSEKPEITLRKSPDSPDAYGEQIFKYVSSADPKALPELAQKLGMQANATVNEVKARLGLGDPMDVAEARAKSGVIPELRELSPSLSADILEHWDRYGPALGFWGQIKHLHEGDAGFHPVGESLKAIPDKAIQDRASRSMRMAHGLVADIRSGVHAYGNELVQALTKGLLSHSRSTDWYGPTMVQHFESVVGGMGTQLGKDIMKAVEDPYGATDPALQRLRDTADNVGGQVDIATRQRALEELNRLEGGEGPRATRYDSLPEHGKWALDFYRRLEAVVRDEKIRTNYPGFEPQPNYAHRLRVPVKNLDKILKGVDSNIRAEFSSAKGRILGRAPHAHRAVRLEPNAEGDALIARTAHMTVDQSNEAIAKWRGELETDIRKAAEGNPKLQAVVDDPVKFKALLHAEMPAFSTDIVDSMRGLLREVQALHTHKVLEEAKRTVVQVEDGRWLPLAVSTTDKGEESAPALAAHFQELHGAPTTTNTYSALGYKAIQGVQSGGYTFHPDFADPINRAYDLHKGDGDGAYRLILKTSGTGKHLIMLNPAWHATNMGGRFSTLLGQNPVRTLQAIAKFKGLTKELSPEQAQNLWDLFEHMSIEHGMVTPQLSEDVVSSAQKYHMQATGDVEAGEPLDVKQPVAGIKLAAAGAWNAVKGVDAWWQNTVSDRFWHQYHNLGVLTFIVKYGDNLERGMSSGDAGIMAASSANRIVGMTSPDRWMYNPTMHKLSQGALFAVNWWRTFPGMALGTYDRMGMKSNPALTHAWALNTAKTLMVMALAKGSTDNVLNWLMSGHWQYQNPPGYQNQITMDRFSNAGQVGGGNLTAGLPTQLGGKTYQQEEADAADPNTGAHLVMEDPLTRQWTDLETALGITESMKQGGMDHWKPEYAGEGSTTVALARMSPFLQMIETGSNLDLYNTVKNRALKWVDPQHPYPFSSPAAWGVGAFNLTPIGYAMQSAVQGATSQDGVLTSGPWKGTKIPGWAMRAFDPNDPLSPILGALGTRGGYPAPISSDERGLSSDEVTELHKIQNDWNDKMKKQQQAVMAGGMTWSDWSYNYKRDSKAYADTVQGKVGGTSHYMQGADGLLSQYESYYNDKQAFDANGDINWSYVQKQQDKLQGQTDPATWRQMIALKDKRELQFPVLHAYKDSLQNYKNFQDTWAKQQKPPIDGEALRNLIATTAGSPNFQQAEAQHPVVAKWYNAKREWELNSKQGFAYGLFTNNQYVMNVLGGTTAKVEAREQQILPQIESEEKAGKFVTPTGQ